MGTEKSDATCITFRMSAMEGLRPESNCIPKFSVEVESQPPLLLLGRRWPARPAPVLLTGQIMWVNFVTQKSNVRRPATLAVREVLQH